MLRDGRDGNRFIINIPGRGYSFVAPVEGPSSQIHAIADFAPAVPFHPPLSRKTVGTNIRFTRESIGESAPEEDMIDADDVAPHQQHLQNLNDLVVEEPAHD
jgi:DNA-binding winged helix-turn-helix (wHTH) protein